MYSTILRFIRFNNFGTWRLNGPRHLFHSFCCTTRCAFKPLRVYEPAFNMDKYDIYIYNIPDYLLTAEIIHHQWP